MISLGAKRVFGLALPPKAWTHATSTPAHFWGKSLSRLDQFLFTLG